MKIFTILLLVSQLCIAQSLTAEKYFDTGNNFLQQANYEKAIDNFQKAVTLKPNFADAYSNMATAYYNLGENAKATKLMQKALQISTNDSTAFSYYQNYYYYPKTLSETFEELQEAVKVNPRDLLAWYFLGIKYLNGNNKKLGLKYIQKAANLGNLSAINYLKASREAGKNSR